MRYKIFQNGEQINTIVADESFVSAYCAENGYTYEAVTPEPVPEPAPTEVEQLRADVDFIAAMTGVTL